MRWNHRFHDENVFFIEDVVRRMMKACNWDDAKFLWKFHSVYGELETALKVVQRKVNANVWDPFQEDDNESKFCWIFNYFKNLTLKFTKKAWRPSQLTFDIKRKLSCNNFWFSKNRSQWSALWKLMVKKMLEFCLGACKASIITTGVILSDIFMWIGWGKM